MLLVDVVVVVELLRYPSRVLIGLRADQLSSAHDGDIRFLKLLIFSRSHWCKSLHDNHDVF